ncbi:MAG: cyclic nucleotide-binding domain-containing protein [Planctomycetes bacterium]|nr:cyclic nucleotide-binding domain-containing protein [Planctomycetota bacterium]
MEEKNRLTKFLKKVKYFASLEDNALNLLRDKMQNVTFAEGEVLCNEGEPGNEMFIIDTGEVAVFKLGKDRIPVEVAILQEGDIAGEMCLFGQDRRSATLRAISETKAWVLDYLTFQRLSEKHSALSKAMLYSLSRHLRRETSIVAKLMSSDLDHRFKVAFFDSKPYTETAFEKYNPYDYVYKFFEPRLTQQTVSMAAGFKAVCAFVNDTLDTTTIEELAGLGIEMIALRCAGYNNVDLEACERNAITVARVPAYSPHAVAEHAVALILALNRRTHLAYNRVRDNNFSLKGMVGFDLYGKTAGIIGAGKIGQCLMNILLGFGCEIMVYTKPEDPSLTERPGVHLVELDELFAKADIISLHAPLTPETYHLINGEALQKMKRGVMLINTSRGALIDAVALLDGLKSGQIGFAGLDVYEEESEYFFEDLSHQVMADDVLARLTTFNNVMLTSHQGFLTAEALANIASTTIENIREFELGKRMGELTYSVVASD